MARGVLWVSSRVVNGERLADDKFCDWYENTHIQEALVLSGVPSAARYEALKPQPDAKAYSNEAPWLNICPFPDIEFRNSDEFKSITASEELVESIYKNVRFDIRFYKEVQVFENEGVKKGPATFIISAALEPPASPEAHKDFDAWYREEHVALLSRAPGFVRSRRYEFVEGTILDRFVPTAANAPRYLALWEFQGDVLPVMGGLVKEEVGLYVLKREYPESEWGSVGVEK
ncbi:uncharacterized protein K460DRAFT_296455 [Cucurbitaria berberidis CBS 394.84]|uniref:EthD domain-containing protein n=1 Tax=Cucurbitaria berberidis CBS 394.84 TaxID=1168544 RepID=A0A9P4G6S6_9PLEO|nr:uncharacterized protein K460DRAFT_296455 [Cucurbitaria berberidis CBS 394.84]KAF1840078.1 hypothetical protein K460DRAFT_296455 [Cucurbitaria berberidis CBS 394.84]